MRASDAVAFAGRCCNYEKCPLRRFTRLSTGPALSLRMEGLAASDLRLCEMAQNRFTVQPLHGTQDDSSHRVVGTERTNRAGSPISGGLTPPKAHQSDYGEGTRPRPPTRPRAPPHGIPKGSARAGRVQRPRRRHSVWQRINALCARDRLPKGPPTLQDTKGTSTTAHAPPRAAAAPQKIWPSHPPICYLTPAPI